MYLFFFTILTGLAHQTSVASSTATSNSKIISRLMSDANSHLLMLELGGQAHGTTSEQLRAEIDSKTPFRKVFPDDGEEDVAV